MKMIQPPSLSTATALIVFGAILSVYSSLACADEDRVPAVTMSVLESEADIQRVISEIRLPEQASPVARERAAKGLETANEARERAREFGQERAEQAREGAAPGKPQTPGRPDNPRRPDNPGNPGRP
jgi:hypothetical protein